MQRKLVIAFLIEHCPVMRRLMYCGDIFQTPLSTSSHPRCRPPRRSTGTLWRSPWGRRRWWEVLFQNQIRELWSHNFHSFIGDRPSWNWWCSGQEAQWQGFWQGIYYKARIGPLVCCVYVWMWSGGMDSGVFSDLVMFDISGVCCARAVLAVEEEQRPLRGVDQGSKNDWSNLCKWIVICQDLAGANTKQSADCYQCLSDW